MYVVAFDNGHISLVSRCFDCYACDIICRRQAKNLTKSTEIPKCSHEVLLAGYIK